MSPGLPFSYRRRTAATIVAAAFLLFALHPGVILADDRELLRSSVGEPYVFILLDTSGSMNWSPKCTQAQFDAGECSPVCPNGDCYAGRQADDPGSKFFQSKEALYEVLKDIDDIHFGFGTYNQDTLNARAKHWLYEAADDGVNVPGAGSFPGIGDQDVFGFAWACDNGNGDAEIGCDPDDPADLGDTWELTRMQRLSKGGLSFNQDVTFYVRQSGTTYRVRYEPVSGSYGSDLEVDVRVSRCDNSSCTNRTALTGSPARVTFRAVGEFLSWDNGDDRSNPQLGYFSQGEAADAVASNTCAGWDPNDDTSSDRFNSTYSLRFPTDTSDSRDFHFDLGDVIPMDWKTSHRDDILRRLAPNTGLDPSATPDFGMATYLRDNRSGSDSFLRLENENARPLFASGSTPLGNSIRSFRTWYAGCAQGNCPRNTGWKDIAAAQDPDWECRRKFLLVLTDGDETCQGADACSGTAALFAQEGIKTFVVAFGVENTSGNRLNCMASNGGSDEPIYPQNKQELVDALTNIFGQIREEASSFASAAVPSVQAEVSDRIYLSSFTPLNAQSIWDGHLDAFLKPLPLTADGRPDKGRACPTTGGSACHLWDAGAVIVTQAPTDDELAAITNLDEASLQLGLGLDERRVFYAQAASADAIPRALRLFSPPVGNARNDPTWLDLYAGLNISAPTDNAEATATKARVEDIIKDLLVVKESTVERVDGTTVPITYVLGDVFHSDPVLLDQPNEFPFFAADLFSNGAATCDDDPGYKCFADKHRRRRKMLLVGTNDGQLHAFDAGVWNPSTQTFGNGSGKEIFSYIPRLVMPIVRELSEGSRQYFSVDGTPRVDDVFLDTVHNGVPTADQREWRTVAVGGFREGGSRDGGGRLADFISGYYALDITQPDRLTSRLEPINQQVVPSCLSAQNQTVSGCGTLPFPSVLWEFTDSHQGSRFDEDLNGFADLGETWSVPTIGRIQVIQDGTLTDKFVAIFGGGMDAENKPSPRRGTWLYMVDIETGKAIYKRPLVGAAPSDPAVVDSDLDGYLDTIYIGTTAGFLYKASFGSPAVLQETVISRTRTLPNLASDPRELRITDTSWSPFPIFDSLGKPFYQTPTVLFVGQINRHAIAIGAGDRENLWSFDGQEGRFYLIIDDTFTASQIGTGDLPKAETDYQEISAEGAAAAAGSDFVLRPPSGNERGWFMRLDANERVITQSFGVSGIVIFSSFQPQILITEEGQGRNSETNCARGGESRIFVVFANNANSVLGSGTDRFRIVPEFITNPYIEQGSTKNPPSGSGSTGAHSEELSATQQQMMEELKKLHPKGTRFGNYWLSVSSIRSDVGYERLATIPIGVIFWNWKEH